MPWEITIFNSWGERDKKQFEIRSKVSLHSSIRNHIELSCSQLDFFLEDSHRLSPLLICSFDLLSIKSLLATVSRHLCHTVVIFKGRAIQSQGKPRNHGESQQSLGKACSVRRFWWVFRGMKPGVPGLEIFRGAELAPSWCVTKIGYHFYSLPKFLSGLTGSSKPPSSLLTNF